MPKMIFVNLPVKNVVQSTSFYEAIGGTKNPMFSDETASCMVFSDTIHAMILDHEKFSQFTPKKIADANTVSEVLICLSAESKAEVDGGESGECWRKGRSGAEAGLWFHVWTQLRRS